MSTSSTKGHFSFFLFWAFFCGVLFVSCRPQSDSRLSLAEALKWRNPDSCILVTEEILRSHPGKHDSLIACLYREHARQRINYYIQDTELVESLCESLESECGDYRHAGEGRYMLGSDACFQGDTYTATYQLKQAEELLLMEEQKDSLLLGITYYRLGHAASDERLWQFARKYYQESIHWLRHTDNYLFLSYAYREVAYTLLDDNQEALLKMMDTALFYAKELTNPAYTVDLEYNYAKFRGESEEALWPRKKYLCDSLMLYGYATEIADYYLNNNAYDSALHYIQLLARDTATSDWFREQYHFQYANYLTGIGDKDSAISVLSRLHRWQTQQIEDNAYTRTYAIAQSYNVLWEQEKSLRLQVEKERLYLLILVLLLSFVLVVGFILFLHYKKLRIYQKNLAEKEMAQRNLQQLIEWRLQQAKALKKSLLTHQLEDLPQWGKEICKTIYLSDTEIDTIVGECNAAYSGLLDSIREQCPDLTKTDAIVIALICSGLSIEDCCILLDVSKETLWKRRKRLRLRLNLPADMSLEDWIAQQKG